MVEAQDQLAVGQGSSQFNWKKFIGSNWKIVSIFVIALVAPALLSFNFINIPINFFFSSSEVRRDSSENAPNDPQNKDSATSPLVSSPVCRNQGERVPCDTSHTVEIMPESFSCDTNGFKEYIAAQSADIISPDIKFNNKQENCEIIFPYSISVSVNSLWESNPKLEPNLRTCYRGNNYDRPIVGCHEEHQGEVVAEFSDAAVPGEYLNCDEAANIYMGLSSNRKWSDTLITESIETSGKWQCIARTRDGSQLESSLKEIGTNRISTRPWG